MAAPVLQFKRGLLANLPGLRAGEPGFTTDSYDLYVGIDSTSNNNKFFGSHRYWKKNTTTTGSGVNLVEGTNNGTDFITLKAPDSLSGIATYTFPATPTANYFLKTAADGTLSWAQISQNSFTGIVTFTDTTDNTLGNENTGSVQINGGAGIAKNLTVKQNLYVGGYSEFIGVVTFRGGTINIGDSNTDNINVGGEFISNLTPNDDNTYDIGIGTQRWRNANFAGVVTATTFSGTVSGTASTATRAQTIDVTVAPNGVYYPALLNNYATGTGYNLYADSGMYYVAQNDTLYINGNLSVGGTSVTLNVNNLLVKDKDIVVGYTTDANGNDVSTDTSSSHGGIAVASTTGSPLFNMPIVAGVNSNPVTYKQFMWIASGTTGYSGMGTDSWVSNYPIAIGTVTVQNNSRFTVGAGFTVFDTYLDATDIRARNINATGIITGTGSGITGVPVSTGISGLGANVATFLATPTSANLASAITDETGTGSLVFANTPTLVTPVLGNASASSINVSGIVTATTFVGALTGTATTATTVNTTTTTTNQNYYIPFVTNNTTTTGETVRVGAAFSVNPSTNTLTIPTIQSSAVKALDGTAAITITNSTGAVTTNSDVTVGGNLYVNGSTTQVNTSQITVEDRTIELGIVDGNAPSSTTTWDLGVLFNYNDGSAKKSALVWEQTDARFKLGSVISDGGGTGNSNPQITLTTYAALELGELWINNTCTGGSSQVIACSGSTLVLQNITLDAGTF